MGSNSGNNMFLTCKLKSDLLDILLQIEIFYSNEVKFTNICYPEEFDITDVVDTQLVYFKSGESEFYILEFIKRDDSSEVHLVTNAKETDFDQKIMECLGVFKEELQSFTPPTSEKRFLMSLKNKAHKMYKVENPSIYFLSSGYTQIEDNLWSKPTENDVEIFALINGCEVIERANENGEFEVFDFIVNEKEKMKKQTHELVH